MTNRMVLIKQSFALTVAAAGTCSFLNRSRGSANARPGTMDRIGESVRRSPLTILVVAMFAASGRCAPALAQDTPAVPKSCDDTFADIYFMPNAKDYPRGLPPGMTQGLPEPHLHLPRTLAQINIGRDDAHWGQEINIEPERFCDRTAFAALSVLVYSTQDLAHRLSLAYDPPSPNGDRLRITGYDKDNLVDDSNDREGMARQGAWVLGGRAAPLYFFCLPPLPAVPSLYDSCYATAANHHMGYKTGTILFDAQPFIFTTFDKPSVGLVKHITIEDVDKYFAFLRALASVVLINTSEK